MYKIARPNQRKKKFLDALAHGWTPTKAAKLAGISRSQAYLWRSQDPEFAADWDEAWIEGVDALEDEAFRRGVTGITREVLDKDGKKTGEIIEYSDQLLMMLMRGRRPERFANQTFQHRHLGQVEVQVKTVEQARQRLLQLGITPPIIEGDYEEVSDPAPDAE